MRTSSSIGELIPFCLMLSIATGCVGPKNVLPDCRIERPNKSVLDEQAAEAERAASGQRPLLPSTYEWLKRMDRDIGIFGEDK